MCSPWQQDRHCGAAHLCPIDEVGMVIPVKREPGGFGAEEPAAVQIAV
jgi:hypothetical protein